MNRKQNDVKAAVPNKPADRPAAAVRSQHSLLAELDDLAVIEAAEFQEGVAFHAFRFKT